MIYFNFFPICYRQINRGISKTNIGVCCGSVSGVCVAYQFKRDKKSILNLELVGDIDLEITPNLKNQLISQLEDARGLVIDARNVSYIDSSGVSVLIIALQSCKTNQIPLQIVAISDNVMKVLQLAKLDKLLPIKEVTGPAQIADVDVFTKVGAQDAELTRDLSDILDKNTSDTDDADLTEDAFVADENDTDLIEALADGTVGGAPDEPEPEPTQTPQTLQTPQPQKSVADNKDKTPKSPNVKPGTFS